MKKLFVAAALLVSCVTPGPVPPTPTATCASVCAHGVELGCTWAEETPKGATCEEVCENASRVVPWNLDCLAAATECGPRVCP